VARTQFQGATKVRHRSRRPVEIEDRHSQADVGLGLLRREGQRCLEVLPRLLRTVHLQQRDPDVVQRAGRARLQCDDPLEMRNCRLRFSERQDNLGRELQRGDVVRRGRERRSQVGQCFLVPRRIVQRPGQRHADVGIVGCDRQRLGVGLQGRRRLAESDEGVAEVDADVRPPRIDLDRAAIAGDSLGALSARPQDHAEIREGVDVLRMQAQHATIALLCCRELTGPVREDGALKFPVRLAKRGWLGGLLGRPMHVASRAAIQRPGRRPATKKADKPVF
jgi:hypothetical protein